MAAQYTDPNLDLDANHDALIISIAVVFSTLSLLTIIARFASKHMNHMGFTIDDHLLTAAWIIATAECGMISAGTKFGGAGRHVVALSMDQLINFQKLIYIASIIQPTTLTLSKLSILILLRRIFVTRKFRITIYILGAIVVAWWISAVFGGAFICSPPNKVWDPTVPGTCGNQKLLLAISPIPWVLTDFAILICPLPVIKQLHLAPGKKLAVVALLMIGFITCVVCVVRYTTLFYPMEDATWDIVPLGVWNMVEAHVTIACAALLACKPVFAWLIPDRVSSAINNRLSAAGSWFSSGSSRKRNTANGRHGVEGNSANDRPGVEEVNRTWPGNLHGGSETKLRATESV